MVGLTANETLELSAQVVELAHCRSELEGGMEMVERIVCPLVMDEDVDLNRACPINQCEREADFLVIRIRVQQLPSHGILSPYVIESID